MADQNLKLKITAETKDAKSNIKSLAKESADEVKRLNDEARKAKQVQTEDEKRFSDYKKSLAKQEADDQKRISDYKKSLLTQSNEEVKRLSAVNKNQKQIQIEDEKRFSEYKKSLQQQELASNKLIAQQKSAEQKRLAEEAKVLQKQEADRQAQNKKQSLALTNISPLRELQTEMHRLGIEQQHLYEWGLKDSKAFQDNAQKINTLKTSIKELQGVSKGFSGKAPLSGFQILEGLENITVALAGFKASISGLAGLVSNSARSFADFKEVADNFKGTAEDINLFQQATGRVVGKGDLIKLSNQATDLGISLRDQPVLFLASKEASEKYGVSVQEAFSKVVSATEGQVRGVKSLGIQKSQYNEVVADLVKATGGEIEAMQGLDGEQEITIKNLDFATQKRIRLEAFLKIYGKTLEDVTNRQQTEADKLHQLDLLLPQIKKQFGELVAKGLVPLSDILKTNEGKFNDTTVAIAGLGFAFSDLVPALASARLAFSGLIPATLVTTLGTLASGIALVASAVGLMYTNLKYAVDLFRNGGSFIDFLTTGAFNNNNVGSGELVIKPLNEIINGATEPSREEFEFYKRTEALKTKGGKGGTGKDLTPKETLTYLADFKKQLTDLQEIMARQTSEENIAGNFIGQEKDLKLLIQFTENIKELLKVTSALATLPETTRESIAPVTIDPLEQFAMALREDDARKQNEKDRIARIESTFESGLSFSQMIASTLSGGADNFATKFLSSIETGASILKSFFNLLNLITGGAGGGLFGFLGGIFGSGGASGTGRAFNPTSQTGGAGAIRTVGVPYIIGTEIQGTTLKQVLRRVDNYENDLLT